MKNIFFVLLIALYCIGCSKDVLDRTPVTQKVIDNFYKTPTDAAQGLAATYNLLTWQDFDGIILVSNIASDDCFGGGGATDGDGFQCYDRFKSQHSDNANENQWQQSYTGIYRANVLIENLDKVNWGTNTALKTQYESEARFLRAYYYFNLTRMFGQVPLVITSTGGNNITGAASAEDIYKFIATDLKFAADNLPNTKFGNIAATNEGHATKWAAEAMLARVFLFYTGYWNKPDLGGIVTLAQVRTYIDDVITNSGHNLVSDFASLWLVPARSMGKTYAGEGNIETVFAIKYFFVNQNNQQHGGGWWERMVGPRSFNQIPYGQGWGAATVNPSLWGLYNAADTRQKASILSWEGEGRTYTNVADQRQYTKFNIKKYEQLCLTNDTPYVKQLGASDWQWDNFEDYMDIRFSDVLLMGAELHLGDNLALANGYIKRVRDRAFKNADPTPVTLTNDNTGKQAIFLERRFELAFEGHRYWDLLRQCGTSFQPLITALSNPDPLHTPDDLQGFFVDGNKAAAVKGLFEIPPVELRLMNNVIPQNAGY